MASPAYLVLRYALCLCNPGRGTAHGVCYLRGGNSGLSTGTANPQCLRFVAEGIPPRVSTVRHRDLTRYGVHQRAEIGCPPGSAADRDTVYITCVLEKGS
jgi:hypothetical protein